MERFSLLTILSVSIHMLVNDNFNQLYCFNKANCDVKLNVKKAPTTLRVIIKIATEVSTLVTKDICYKYLSIFSYRS